jgi:hypothetical protein
LLERVGITLNEAESYLVERLEVFATWAGRYRIPLTLEGYLPRTAPHAGSGSLRIYISSDPDMNESLAERLLDDCGQPD